MSKLVRELRRGGQGVKDGGGSTKCVITKQNVRQLIQVTRVKFNPCSCAHGNEFSGCAKGEKGFDQLTSSYLYKRAWFHELVS